MIKKFSCVPLLYLVVSCSGGGGSDSTSAEANICDPIIEGTSGNCVTTTYCTLGQGCIPYTHCTGTSTDPVYSDACLDAIANNKAPTANAGPDVFTIVGKETVLDTSGSTDPEGSELTSGWFVYSTPPYSTPALDGQNLTDPTKTLFTADKFGSYVFSLHVVDEFTTSRNQDLIRVIAESDNLPSQFSSSPIKITLPIQPEYVLEGDFNKDNKNDLLIANTSTVNNYLVLLGDGAGGFIVNTPFTGPVCKSIGATGDYNNDLNLDFIVTGQSEMFLMAGNGLGQFTSSTVPGHLSQVAAGDFDGDNDMDIIGLTQNTSPSEFSLLLGNGAGSFTSKAINPAGYYPSLARYSYAVADFNNDSISDVVYISLASNATIISGQSSGNVDAKAIESGGRTTVLLGTNTGDFVALGAQTTTTDMSYIGIGDFNKDGRIDFMGPGEGIRYGTEEQIRIGTSSAFFTRFVTLETLMPNISVYLGNGSGLFTRSELAGIPDTPLFVSFGENVIGDFNKDGKSDVLVYHPARSTAGYISIYYGDGSGKLNRMKQDKILDASTGAALSEIMAFDINSDYKDDIIFTVNNDSNIYLLPSN